MPPKAKKMKITIAKAKKKGSRWPQTITYTVSSTTNPCPPEASPFLNASTTNPNPSPTTNPKPSPNTASSTTNTNPEPSTTTTSSNTYFNTTSYPNPTTFNTCSAMEFDDFTDGSSPENLPFDWILRNNICGVRFFQNSIKQKQQIHVIQGKFLEYSQNNFILDFQLISSSTMEYQVGFVACILFVVEYKDCKRLFIACSGCDSSSAFQKVGHCFYTG